MNAARCSSGTHTVTWDFSTETFVTSGSRVKSVLPWAMTKWTNHIVALYEEEDEDTFLEEGPQIEIGTVFLRDTCHRESY